METVMHKKIRAELDELSSEIEAAAKQLEETAAFGDFRENEPFQIAKSKYVSLQNEYSVKEKILENISDNSPEGMITEGKLLKIVYLGTLDSNNVLTEQTNENMLLLFSNEGDPVVNGVLSSKSALGRLINKGRGGRYSVNIGNQSKLYDVSIYTGDSDEYFRRYPASKKVKISRLLEGEIL